VVFYAVQSGLTTKEVSFGPLHYIEPTTYDAEQIRGSYVLGQEYEM